MEKYPQNKNNTINKEEETKDDRNLINFNTNGNRNNFPQNSQEVLNINMGNNPISSEDHNMSYYHEYCRLFIANTVLNSQMKELVKEKNELFLKLNELEKKTNEYNAQINESFDKKKRLRRTAEEIVRHYQCPIESCLKNYGSEGSLNQHIKLKHPDYFRKMIENKDDEPTK